MSDRWDVFRQTPTKEVWACMGREIEAGDGEAAIAAVTADLPGHLLGAYFAVLSDSAVTAFVRERVERSRTVEVVRC